jgi:pilus assembly protein CpaB
MEGEILKKVKIIALVSAVVTALLLFLFLNSLSQSSGGAQGEVVTASVHIPSNTEITADMVTVTRLSEEAIHQDALKDTKLVVGKATNSDILAGEQILSKKLIAPGESGNDTLAYAIKPGMRAITIGVNEITGLSGMIKPQDRVDIIAEFEGAEATTMVVENVTVLAVDSVMEKKGKLITKEGMATPYTTITLQVTKNEAMKLSMSEYKGRLRVILRSPLDDKTTNQPDITSESVMKK